jgi:hypothetical protein
MLKVGDGVSRPGPVSGSAQELQNLEESEFSERQRGQAVATI